MLVEVPTKKIRAVDQKFFIELGGRIRKTIIIDLKYPSLDAFSLEYHDLISKPTLYQISNGKRDMKISTLRRLAETLGISIQELIQDL